MIGHCAGAMLFDMAGVIDGKTIAVHPLAKSAIQKGKATETKIQSNFSHTGQYIITFQVVLFHVNGYFCPTSCY